MQRVGNLALFLLAILLVPAIDVCAQSITVTPSMPYVAVGGTVQFSATVTGLSGKGVTWSAGGKVGGNATSGKITATGLYTAPATLPGQNPVQVTATSISNKRISGSTYVNIESLGPTITSVSPNPLAVGAITVTVSGKTFVTGAEVYISYGSNSLIQMVTTAVTSTTVMATGYLGPAISASFCVRNPGSTYSNSISVPAGSLYTLTVTNGRGSGSYASGTVVTITANPPPSGEVFQDWTGATVTNPDASTTTLTMPASNVTVTATYSGPSTIPFPVTTHPRLWITQNDLPRLQSWATASNPTYVNGMQPMLQTAVSLYQTQFFPGGVPNPNYPDPGDVQGYTGYLTEQYAAILAFNSLIDPNPANRITYAQYARNMLMYALNQAALGHLANAPFRDPAFAIYNRANFSGDQWPLIVDWIYNATNSKGNPILTASDKATIQVVFMMWANDCLNAETTGGDHPSPIGTMNSLELLPNNLPYRMASNNYFLGHARLLTMMSLVLDPADDPPVNSTQPASVLGNSLRSYIQDATGAWLYQEFAMMGDPSVVPPAYGLPANTPGFGLASGGMPPEGMLYGHSFGFVLGQLLALQTAGFNNPAYSGPQIGLIGAPVWDRWVTGTLSSLTPGSAVPSSETWLGPVYQFDSFGDLLRLYVTPDFMQPYALLALLVGNASEIVPRHALLWEIWGYGAGIRTRTLDVHVRRVRKKLGGYADQYIETIFGIGYRFQPYHAPRYTQATPAIAVGA